MLGEDRKLSKNTTGRSRARRALRGATIGIPLAPTLAFALVACAGAPTAPSGASGQGRGSQFEDPTLEPRVEALQQRTLRLLFNLDGAKRSERLAIEAWLHEALAQSSWLDIAAKEDGLSDASDSIVVRGMIRPDGRSILTTTLVRSEDAPVALAGIREAAWPEIAENIDRLALETRRTLGESLASIRRDARSTGALVSSDARVAAACSRARELLANRRLTLADAALKQALARDPNCALALSLAAGTRIDLGRSKSAVEFARRALALEARLSPAAAQRAARVVLLAEQSDARGLLELATRTLEQRPVDAGARFTRGLAFALDGQYDRALPALEKLRDRYPVSPGLLFSLAHSRLATGDLDGARELLADVDRHVPALPAARLRAFVLIAAEDHKGLTAHLDQLERQSAFRGAAAKLTLLTMRASHAILQERDDDAERACLEIFDRLRALPFYVQRTPSVVSELAWTLARLGRAEDAIRALAALRGPKGFPEAIRPEMAFTAGLLALAAEGKLDPTRIRNVQELGNTQGARRLEAMAYRKRGQIDRALRSFREAARDSSDPVLVLEIAECEALAGRVEKSNELERELIQALTRPRLDAPREHPLLRPSYALALRYAKN